MPPEFDQQARRCGESLIRLALQEDLQDVGDLTSLATIPSAQQASVNIVSRGHGIFAAAELIPLVFAALQADVQIRQLVANGELIQPGTTIAQVSGDVRMLLIAERTILNFLTHLCGVASLTAQYADAVRNTSVILLDTRKTLPGWRALQKFAVRCGGGTNHRMGLYDGILIKDNHLAARQDRPADAVHAAQTFLQQKQINAGVEIEVDTLEQLRDVLSAAPDIVLLDNMTCDQLCTAVELRNQHSPQTLLEASGGITLQTIREIAETGVDRISVGGLTHSATATDLGFDWNLSGASAAQN